MTHPNIFMLNLHPTAGPVALSESERSSTDGGTQEFPVQEERSSFDSKLKSVSGASLFLIAVEVAWQLHNR